MKIIWFSKRNLIVGLIFLFFPNLSFAQIDSLKNNIFIELFGNAGGYSLNYDRIIIGGVNLRGGIMVLKSQNDLGLAFPLLINYRFDVGHDFLEIGVGKTYYNLTSESKKLGFIEIKGNLWTSAVSYRIQSENGINYRIAFTPFYYERKFIPFGGLSIGYSF